MFDLLEGGPPLLFDTLALSQNRIRAPEILKSNLLKDSQYPELHTHTNKRT